MVSLRHSFALAALLVATAGPFARAGQGDSPAGAQQSPPAQAEGKGGPGALPPGIDLEPRPLERIPVGTVIGKRPPAGWTNLILFAVPTLTPEDQRDAPQIAMHYARMFKFTLLGNVTRRPDLPGAPHVLDRVARGFATTVRDRETVIQAGRTLDAQLGLFGRRILEENEAILDNDVRQIVRTPNLVIFDAKSVMLRDGEHRPMVMRHAVLVDPDTGKLQTLVWLLTDRYEAAEDAMQLLPEGLWEQRLLSVKRDRFTFGIPDREAFALRRIPQGTAVPYTPALRQAATVRTFTAAQVPDIEATLRAHAAMAR